MSKRITSHRVIIATLLIAIGLCLSRGSSAQTKERGIKVKVGATSTELASPRGAEVGLWAVLIGVSRYQYGDQDLDGCCETLCERGHDCGALVSVFIGPCRGIPAHLTYTRVQQCVASA